MQSVNHWTAVTAEGSIPAREGRSVCLEGRDLAIFNLNGRFLTIDNKCPHKGGPLCDGIVADTAVVCPLHGRRFDLETGVAMWADRPEGVGTYPTRVEQGIVYVSLGAREGEI